MQVWKSDTLSKDAGRWPAGNVTLPQVFFKHFASKNELPGLSIIGTLIENGLKINCQHYSSEFTNSILNLQDLRSFLDPDSTSIYNLSKMARECADILLLLFM